MSYRYTRPDGWPSTLPPGNEPSGGKIFLGWLGFAVGVPAAFFAVMLVIHLVAIVAGHLDPFGGS